MVIERRGDERPFMLRALRLAARGRGRTRPNPTVGAVVVRHGRIVGEGWHRACGSDHAEVVALAAAGERARGATMLVTLEPCAHTGRTPPCVDALILNRDHAAPGARADQRVHARRRAPGVRGRADPRAHAGLRGADSGRGPDGEWPGPTRAE